MTPRDQVGAATILAVAVMGVLVSVTLAVGGVVAAVAAHRQAQSAADLAALAGAGAVRDSRDACQQARAIARSNGAALRRCQVDGWDVAVVVSTSVRLPGGAMDLPARGRAGPVGDESPGASGPALGQLN